MKTRQLVAFLLGLVPLAATTEAHQPRSRGVSALLENHDRCVRTLPRRGPPGSAQAGRRC